MVSTDTTVAAKYMRIFIIHEVDDEVQGMTLKLHKIGCPVTKSASHRIKKTEQILRNVLKSFNRYVKLLDTVSIRGR